MRNKSTFLGMLSVLLLILSSCGFGSEKIPDQTNWKLEEFSAVNQDEKEYSLEDIKGNVTIASFIFTSCTTVCSPMTANMSKLQKKTEEEGLDVQYLSFSVDPEVDTPEVLKEFGSRFDINYSNWNFVTGYTQQEIEAFGQKNFKTIVAKPKGGGEVVHGTSFYLINQEGVIIKSYDGLDVPFEEVIEHVKIVNEN